MSLTQIAAGAGMQPSKAHRYLVSLARVGLVAQSPSSGRYDMGPSMRRLGVESLRRMDEVALVSEHLTELRDRTSHAVNLAVWGDHGPVVVRWEYGAHALPITVRVGATMPLLTSAMGGAFLSPICPNRSPNPCCAGSCRRRRWTRRPRATVARIKEEVRREGVGPPRPAGSFLVSPPWPPRSSPRATRSRSSSPW
ncbi:IclR family transcriptional regulator [Streptomyces sp. KL116D]|uniref:IclR family transcriptional regulator n=1 Tax=Streptomyces sp. KL116D TaxID=3045152 RepID=UPI003558DF6B